MTGVNLPTGIYSHLIMSYTSAIQQFGTLGRVENRRKRAFLTPPSAALLELNKTTQRSIYGVIII